MNFRNFFKVLWLLKLKEEGLVYFFCDGRYPWTDFFESIFGDENDGEIKNIGFISFFALEADFVNPARVLAEPRS